VRLTKRVEKQLRRVPVHIREQLEYWIATVETDGLDSARKVPGYHDEPLLGRRVGQRSIRLSRSYRAIYEVKRDIAQFVSVEEVSKHDYRS
jgi:toxin HigB-1